MRKIGCLTKRVIGFSVGFLVVMNPGFSQGSSFRIKKYAVVLREASVRNMPSARAKVVYIAKGGEKLTILDDLGIWLKVKIPGGFGFIRSNSVKVEQVKMITPPTGITSLKTSGPLMARFMKKKFSINFSFNYAFVNPEDFNSPVKFSNQLENDWARVAEEAGHSAEIDHLMQEIKHLPGGSFEGKYFFTRNMAVNFGLTYLSRKKSSSTNFSLDSTGLINAEANLKVSMIVPYLGLSFFLPYRWFSVEFFTDAGYFMGRFSQNSHLKLGSLIEEYKQFKDMNKSVLGYIAGARLNINLNRNMGIFLEGKYAGVNFKDILGHLIINTNGIQEERAGTVYYYEINASIHTGRYSYSDWYPVLDVYENSAPSKKNLRKAEFNFSGFYLGGGFFLRF